MKRPVLVLAVVVLVVGSSRAQAPLPALVRDAAGSISASQLQRDVEWMAATDLQGRATPSQGLDKAIDSLTARLTAAGVKPLGDAGSYLQRYDIDRFAIDLSASTIRLGDRVFKPGDDFVIRYATQSLQMQTPVAFVGHGTRTRVDRMPSRRMVVPLQPPADVTRNTHVVARRVYVAADNVDEPFGRAGHMAP